MALPHPPPAAAYIYLLRLDQPGIAWEYVRRDPRYRSAWRQRKRRKPARWSMNAFEDPALDARMADPIWSPSPTGQVYLSGEEVRGSDQPVFSLWHLPGPVRLMHDGFRMRFTGIAGRFGIWTTLGNHFRDGASRSYAVQPHELTETIAAIDQFEKRLASPSTQVDLPSRQAVAHMRAFQALDAIEAGYSEREIGTLMFGDAVLKEWHAESPVRAAVRDAVRRGRRYRDGHWRSLLWPLRQRRFGKTAESP
ncbi:MAG: DUF2285 domain-containing protein [Sphingobium sp.]